jgi:hypothetical protein
MNHLDRGADWIKVAEEVPGFARPVLHAVGSVQGSIEVQNMILVLGLLGSRENRTG